MFYRTLLTTVVMCLALWQQGLSFSGNTKQYPASAIPTELKAGANAVIRSETTTFRVLSAGKAVKTVEKVVTVLNKQGDDAAILVCSYDKLDKIKKIEGSLYAANGDQLRKLKKSEIVDNSYYSSVSFFHDNRYKAARLSHHSYPYTVVWETEEEMTNMLFYPVWVPHSAEKVSIEKASFVITSPAGLVVHHRTNSLAAPSVTTLADGSQQYHWEVKNVAVATVEYYSPAWAGSSYVITAPEAFELDGVPGSLKSWQALGAFIQQLNQGRAKVSEELKAELLRRTASCKNTEEKVKVVYEYMQQNTRYVSIQLGIGGWQPFEASFVQEKGYGDCKALSNYTYALLKAIDIPSHYALIAAGADATDRVLEDFPRSYFNHAILCVPLEKDTVWLECTSQTNPFNHLGSFTGNRKALLITDQGGKLVNTHYYAATDNLQQSKITVSLQQEQPQYQLFRTYRGVQFDDPFSAMRADVENQKNWLHKAAALPDIQLEQYKLWEQKGQQPVMVLEAKGKLQSTYRSGNRLFLPLSPGKFPLEVPRPAAERHTDFVQAWGYTYADTLTYLLPNGYTLEHLPEQQQMKTSFGEYVLKAEHIAGKLVCTSTLRVYDGKYPATAYNEWVTFLQQAAKAYAAKAVLVQE